MVPESIFSQGQMPTLKEVLASREQRAFFEEEISKTNANQTLISLKCNIPGPVKYNAVVRQISEIGIQEVKNAIQTNKWKVTYEKLMDLDTGSGILCRRRYLSDCCEASRHHDRRRQFARPAVHDQRVLSGRRQDD